MIYDERMETFLNTLNHGNPDFLQKIEDKARADGVPVIRKDTQSYLRTLLAMTRPEKILEVGCAVGFSAMLMAECTHFTATITTIEKDKVRAAEARKNFSSSRFAERITLIEGDADEVLPALEGPFDFIFMDAAKAQYVIWLPQVIKLLSNGGVLVTDNVLQEGVILESHYACVRRDRTIYKRMREFLYAVTHDDKLETSVLPVGDGLAVSVKKYESS